MHVFTRTTVLKPILWGLLPLIAKRSPGLALTLSLGSSRRGKEKKQRPFVVGHSQGGMETPWFPQEEEGSVDGIGGPITFE